MSDSSRGTSARRTSARLEPFWLNPATIKGTIAILSGGFVLFAPAISVRLLNLIIGVALIVAGVSDSWFPGRSPVGGRRRILEAILSVVVGIFFLVFPTETVRTLAVIGGIYLAVRGVTVVSVALRQRSLGEPWGVDLSRGWLQVIAGAVAVIMPESVVEGVLLGAAVVVVILGAIMLSYGLSARNEEKLLDVDAATVLQLMVHWIKTRDVGAERRTEIGDGLFFEEPERGAKLTSWWVMLLLSVAIATFGILQDSTAVVIGAMLIAPLMTPILGSAAGIVNVRPGRVGASLALIAAGVAASIGLAWIVGAWTPAIVPLEVNSQVTSRVSPNVVDMLIGLAAGAAGAYATVDRRVSSSIAGVAIAVALVPPLGVVGVMLNAGLIEDGLGAFLLFLTNLVAILLSATFVFFLTGYAPFEKLKQSRREVGALMGTILTVALIILIPLVFTGEGVLSASSRQHDAQALVGDWLVDEPDLSATKIEVDGAEVGVLLSGVGQIPSLEELEDSLAESFGEPVVLTVAYTPTLIVRYSDAEGRTELVPEE
jgi:uncharacterized hydrophobic protein (TIGR00271 family)